MTHCLRKRNISIDLEVLEESALAMAQSTIQNAINEAKISQADLARRMRCNRSVVSRILGGGHNLTIKTMAKALAACGSEIRFQTVPIEWNWGAVSPTSNNALPSNAGSAMTISSRILVGIALPTFAIGENIGTNYC